MSIQKSFERYTRITTLYNFESTLILNSGVVTHTPSGLKYTRKNIDKLCDTLERVGKMEGRRTDTKVKSLSKELIGRELTRVESRMSIRNLLTYMEGLGYDVLALKDTLLHKKLSKSKKARSVKPKAPRKPTTNTKNKKSVKVMEAIPSQEVNQNCHRPRTPLWFYIISLLFLPYMLYYCNDIEITEMLNTVLFTPLLECESDRICIERFLNKPKIQQTIQHLPGVHLGLNITNKFNGKRSVYVFTSPVNLTKGVNTTLENRIKNINKNRFDVKIGYTITTDDSYKYWLIDSDDPLKIMYPQPRLTGDPMVVRKLIAESFLEATNYNGPFRECFISGKLNLTCKFPATI